MLFAAASMSLFAVAAQAQTKPPEPATGATALPEIVVTAQKREQSLQDVPISVSAFGADFLAKTQSNTLGDLQQFTPGLTVDDSSITQPKFSIRGISTDDFGVGTDPAVAIFIDGVYSGRSGSSLVFFNDVARVEVLKGPQGTLFGRNTAAGAISIVTNKPDATPYYRVMGRLGNYGAQRLEITANTPLTDQLDLRINVVGNKRDGFLKNSFNGDDLERQNNATSRVALRWRPTAGTDVNFSWDHDDTYVDGPPAIGIGPYAPGGGSPFGRIENDVLKSRESRLLDGFTLIVEQQVGGLTLSSTSGYKTFKTRNREDEDGTALLARYFDTDNRENNKSFYQELRVSGDAGPVRFTGGLSYFWEDAHQTSAALAFTDSVDTTLLSVAGIQLFTPFAEAGLPVLGIPWHEDMFNHGRNTSYAAFGDATWAVTDKLDLIFGGRYTHDKKAFTWLNGPHIAPGLNDVQLPGSVFNDALGAEVFPADQLIGFDDFVTTALGGDLIFNVGPLEGIPFTRTDSWSNFSPRGVVQYHWTPNLMTYLSVARGYKAGGFNSVEINSHFNPEKITNIEVGVKAESFDRRLRTNLSVYQYKYKDRQQISLETISGSGVPQYVTITGDSTGTGVDFDAQWLAAKGLTFSASAGYIDSTWDKRTERGVDIAGQPTGEPKFKGVIGVDYTYELAGGSRIDAHADYSYASAQRRNDAVRLAEADLAPLVNFGLLKGYYAEHDLADARVSWTSADDRYSIALWVNNLFDRQYVEGINDITAATLQTPYTRLTTPRFFGVDLTFKY